jgi:hypothetical protein
VMYCWAHSMSCLNLCFHSGDDVIFSWFTSVIAAANVEDSWSSQKSACKHSHLEWYFLDHELSGEVIFVSSTNLSRLCKALSH